MLIARRTPAALCIKVCDGGMNANALINTGAILALLDRTDRWHLACVDAFEQLRLPLVTSQELAQNGTPAPPGRPHSFLAIFTWVG